MRIISSAIARLSRISGYVAVVTLFSMLLLIIVEITARNLFSFSLLVTTEVSGWLLLALVFLGAAWTLSDRGHIQICLLSSRLSEKDNKRLTIVLALIGAIFTGILSFQIGVELINNYEQETMSFSLLFPLWWAWVPMFLGSIILCLQFVGVTIESALSLKELQNERGRLSIYWLVVLGVVTLGLVFFLLFSGLTPTIKPAVALLIVLALVFLFVGSSLWIFASLSLVGMLSLALFTKYPPMLMATQTMFFSNTSFVLVCIPLFILMGELFYHSGVSYDLYSGIAPWVERIPGRLFHSNILSCTIFAAISGSSAVTTATIGSVAIPELKKLKYDEKLATGSLAGAGTLGILIPPSIPMIVYGAMTSNSIGRLFIGGIVPGLMLSALFMIYIGFRSVRNPKLAPHFPLLPWKQRLIGTAKIIPVILIIGAVLGLIYAGITTPTEAGAIGAFCALISILASRKLNWQNLRNSSFATIRTTCFIMLIFSGASILSVTVAYLRIPQELTRMLVAAGLSSYTVLIIVCIIYLGLGCLFDGISMMVLTLPIIYPVLTGMGFDGIWFGILLIILIEVAQITPPVGFNLYILQNLTKRDIGDVVIWTIPFFLIMCLAMVIIIVFPQIVTFLPNMIMG